MVAPLSSDGVNLVDENDGGRVFFCHPEELSNQLGPVPQVLLDELGAHHTQEGGGCLISYGLGEKCLTWWAKITCWKYSLKLSISSHRLRECIARDIPILAPPEKKKLFQNYNVCSLKILKQAISKIRWISSISIFEFYSSAARSLAARWRHSPI